MHTRSFKEITGGGKGDRENKTIAEYDKVNFILRE